MSLKAELNEIRDRIVLVREDDPDERNTVRTLVLPLFGALGYDTESINDVENEYRVSPRSTAKVDLAIKNHGTPVILVECKRIREELDW